MKTYITQIRAIDPKDGELKTYAGPHVPAISFGFAEEYCQHNGLGYCEVIGELIAEIPCKSDSAEADFGNRLDYDNYLN